uniref:Ferredoxin-thioredoxin reductase catalytic chain, chloroplastic n=1 Tax=Hordeum vulgare subsp. vulgare TaxID=112509 RepID=A0A8I6XKE4_HORVV
MMSITSTAGTLLCPPPVSRGGWRGGRYAVRAQAPGDGGAADSSEQKSVEIMRKFSEQYARRSSTFFCSDKSVTAIVIKKKKPLFCTGLLTTRINSELLSAPAGIMTTRPPSRPKTSGTARASPCEKGGVVNYLVLAARQ